jgi:hypothetical protein
MQEPPGGADAAKACLHPIKASRAIIELGLDHSFMAVECGACGRIIPKAVFQRVMTRKRGRKGPRT